MSADRGVWAARAQGELHSQPPPAARLVPDAPPWFPTIAVVMPVLDEQDHIRDSVASVFAQEYPAELIEIVVADGGSRDRTRQIVTELMTGHPNLRLIDNPGRNQAAGLNRAVACTRGEIVARLDGHAAWDPLHLRRCVDLLAETGADNVGGRMAAIGDTAVARAVALATSSPLGVGGARFHYATRMRETDTVFLGCFRRSALERVGPFNEASSPHEDYELNHRIRASGGQIIFSPDISTVYWARANWRRVARQYLRYGRAKARVARESPGVLRPYHLIPPLFIAAIPPAAALLFTTRGRRSVASIAAFYVAACLFEGARTAGTDRPEIAFRTALVFPVLHASWGLGFWSGVMSPQRRPASHADG